MEIRNVQRTGNMHYMYLPTNWCKKNKVDSDSKVFIETQSDGALIISSEKREIKQKHLELKINESDSDIIHKLIVAAYINPLKSFKITLNKEMNMAKILDQKKLISIESVELDGKTITCESNIVVNDPMALVKTIVNKIKNLLIIIKDNYNLELIERYEEEIDRSKLLIDKSVISSLTNNQSSNQKPIELYYISLLSKDLERMVDHIIKLDQKEKAFLDEVYDVISLLKKILDSEDGVEYKSVIIFIKSVLKIQEPKPSKLESYLKKRIRQYLLNISEVLLDFAITNKVEE